MADTVLDALNKALAHIKALESEPAYFMCNDWTFNNQIVPEFELKQPVIFGPLRMSIRYYQIGPTTQLRVLPGRMGFIVSQMPISNGTIFKLSQEWGEQFLQMGEYNPTTDKFNHKPVRI